MISYQFDNLNLSSSLSIVEGTFAHIVLVDLSGDGVVRDWLLWVGWKFIQSNSLIFAYSTLSQNGHHSRANEAKRRGSENPRVVGFPGVKEYIGVALRVVELFHLNSNSEAIRSKNTRSGGYTGAFIRSKSSSIKTQWRVLKKFDFESFLSSSRRRARMQHQHSFAKRLI